MKIKPIYLASVAGAIVVLLVGALTLNNRHDHMMGDRGYGHEHSNDAANGAYGSARYVSVVGDGSVKVVPDSVRVDASISTLAPTSAASLASTAKSADQLRRSLKGSGVEAKFIQAVNLSTNPEYSYSNNGPAKITGYRSTQNFTIVIRDAKNSGLIIQSAQSAVGNALSISATSPYVFDQKTAQANARALAIVSAKEKAASYASLTGSQLGKVLAIDEQVNQSGPVPMMAMAKAANDSAAPVQVDLGQQTITVTVTTKWELR